MYPSAQCISGTSGRTEAGEVDDDGVSRVPTDRGTGEPETTRKQKNEKKELLKKPDRLVGGGGDLRADDADDGGAGTGLRSGAWGDELPEAPKRLRWRARAMEALGIPVRPDTPGVSNHPALFFFPSFYFPRPSRSVFAGSAPLCLFELLPRCCCDESCTYSYSHGFQCIWSHVCSSVGS